MFSLKDIAVFLHYKETIQFDFSKPILKCLYLGKMHGNAEHPDTSNELITMFLDDPFKINK